MGSEGEVRHGYAATSLGELLLVADGAELCGVYFPGHWHPPAAGTIGERVEVADDAVLAQASAELDEYLRGERTVFDVPRRGRGSAFDRRVWAALEALPFGTTTTYGAIARELGDAKLARRVGYAVGHNPISIIVGCHRVLGANGKLTGYAGGLERKQLLLELEGQALPLGMDAGVRPA
ncbi:MAG: methylated-DNA--[protein]-cysteine S-methyltransferase [Microbacteriaceae bacterium]|nr:methylated-DNA--[protein]-cysteine S-methyltransferase [Microbacteriaceae bacterium]MCL2796337.1 methylated-DNA--[protein]-cysteine S-methyltransferase [Microbacteriaceae bacterium]